MAKSNEEVFTAGKIAEALSVPPAQVKKAIDALKIRPAMKKGACSYYSADSLKMIKSSLKK